MFQVMKLEQGSVLSANLAEHIPTNHCGAAHDKVASGKHAQQPVGMLPIFFMEGIVKPGHFRIVRCALNTIFIYDLTPGETNTVFRLCLQESDLLFDLAGIPDIVTVQKSDILTLCAGQSKISCSACMTVHGNIHDLQSGINNFRQDGSRCVGGGVVHDDHLQVFVGLCENAI